LRWRRVGAPADYSWAESFARTLALFKASGVPNDYVLLINDLQLEYWLAALEEITV
jgi:hypothetical protein